MKKFISVFASIAFLFGLTVNSIYATNPPSFPSCTTFSGSGNWSSSNGGLHHIPGQEAPIEGDDDVYYINNGDFVQCLCKANSTTGIQTNWWRIDNTLSQDQINSYKNQGWYFEFGGDWNLLHTNYLAKNTEYMCREPEPTPTATPTTTPTPTPTVTPTATPSPTATPTGGGDHSSECTELRASTVSGSAPLTVQFYGGGADSQGYIEAYQFNFNDTSGGQPQLYTSKDSSAAHRYENPGVYTASLLIKDSKGVWKGHDQKCRVTINVSSTPQVLGASDTKELPKTGAAFIFVAVSFLSTAVGAELYRRNRE